MNPDSHNIEEIARFIHPQGEFDEMGEADREGALAFAASLYEEFLVPAFNEQERLQRSVRRLQKKLDEPDPDERIWELQEEIETYKVLATLARREISRLMERINGPVRVAPEFQEHFDRLTGSPNNIAPFCAKCGLAVTATYRIREQFHEERGITECDMCATCLSKMVTTPDRYHSLEPAEGNTPV